MSHNLDNMFSHFTLKATKLHIMVLSCVVNLQVTLMDRRNSPNKTLFAFTVLSEKLVNECM